MIKMKSEDNKKQTSNESYSWALFSLSCVFHSLCLIVFFVLIWEEPKLRSECLNRKAYSTYTDILIQTVFDLRRVTRPRNDRAERARVYCTRKANPQRQAQRFIELEMWRPRFSSVYALIKPKATFLLFYSAGFLLFFIFWWPLRV